MRAVIFDMDGVIFDSERLYLSCWKKTAEKHGIPGIEEAVYRCIGVTETATRQIMLETYGPDFPIDAMREETDAYFREAEAGGLPVKPGAAELLSALHSAGIPKAIASSTRRDIVTRELADAGLLGWFDEIVGGDQVRRSKPAPDIFLEAAARLGVPPGECAVVEDSFNGIRAARAAGMTALMVPDLLQPDEEIRALADQVLPSLDAVRIWLLPEA